MGSLRAKRPEAFKGLSTAELLCLGRVASGWSPLDNEAADRLVVRGLLFAVPREDSGPRGTLRRTEYQMPSWVHHLWCRWQSDKLEAAARRRGRA